MSRTLKKTSTKSICPSACPSDRRSMGPSRSTSIHPKKVGYRTINKKNNYTTKWLLLSWLSMVTFPFSFTRPLAFPSAASLSSSASAKISTAGFEFLRLEKPGPGLRLVIGSTYRTYVSLEICYIFAYIYIICMYI